MTGEGWVWIGNDAVAATLLQADKDVKKSAEGLVAVSPRSKALILSDFLKFVSLDKACFHSHPKFTDSTYAYFLTFLLNFSMIIL